MDESHPSSPSWQAWVRGGVVVYGEATRIAEFLQAVERTATRIGVRVVYVRSSGSKLWIKEGDEP